MTPWWTDPHFNLSDHLAKGAVGLLVGVIAMFVGIVATGGKYKRLILGILYLIIALGILAHLCGIVAIILRQPTSVYFPLLWIGFVCAGVFGALVPVVRWTYRLIDRQQNRSD